HTSFPRQVPCTQKVALSVGSSVIIKGTPCISFGPANTSCDLPSRNDPELQVDFHISPDEKSDIAFHFRVYFGRLVVMNTRQSGKWENEVKSSTMPFEDGKPFDLHLLVLHNEYQVIVNRQYCYSFAHRIQPSSVQMVQVWRDIRLTSSCNCN
uniref:Galectin n=1 Tax=Castor canadensis TaxID=51338 RepID=A0A8C0W6S4_CASCN